MFSPWVFRLPFDHALQHMPVQSAVSPDIFLLAGLAEIAAPPIVPAFRALAKAPKTP
jgi:hypothetical protein